jgi:type II secretory pathway component PulF
MGCVGFVLPQFAGVFEQFEVPLPTLTQVLLAVATALRSHILIWMPLAVMLTVATIAATKTKSGRRYVDTAVLYVVVLKDISRAFNVGRTFRLLGLLIESGVPLLEGIRLTRKSVRNVLFRGLFDNMEEAILNGRTLSTAVIDAEFLPPAAREMMMTAERTGTLGSVTQMIGEHYEEEGEVRLEELAGILEPLIIIVMGTVVATVVLAVMLPMFDIATLTRH